MTVMMARPRCQFCDGKDTDAKIFLEEVSESANKLYWCWRQLDPTIAAIRSCLLTTMTKNEHTPPDISPTPIFQGLGLDDTGGESPHVTFSNDGMYLILQMGSCRRLTAD